MTSTHNEPYLFDWADLAFGSKKPLSSLKATFVVIAREISEARFKEIFKQYAASGPVVFAFAKEAYIDGFEQQPQFKTQNHKTFLPLIEQANKHLPHKTYVLLYDQKDIVHIVPKLKPRKVIFVRASWLHAFHTTPTYYMLMRSSIPYELISPFTSEDEAKQYARKLAPNITRATALPKTLTNDDTVIQKYMSMVAKRSYDNSFQTGLILARKSGKLYRILGSAHNKIVPYETYAMYFGAAREENLSPPHDLNHYDTVHAEVEMLIEAQRRGINLKNATVFLNLLPCPTCARMLCDTDISEVVYVHDHSDGYALALLTKSGKHVRRCIPA